MSKFQEKYESYLRHANASKEDELAHFGVPGMKWGVRKSVYKSLNRRQRKALKAYGTGRHGADIMEKAGRPKSSTKSIRNYKSKLEKAMGVKINDKSAAGSGKNSIILRQLTLGLPGNVATAIARSSRMNRQSNMSNSELKKYLGKRRKNEIPRTI